MSSIPQTVSELFPSKYLIAEDLKGKAFTLEIERTTLEQMRDRFQNQDVMKIVLYFKGAHKGLTLNKTQSFKMAQITGTEEFKQWAGQRVTLRPGLAKNGKATIVIEAAPAEQIK